ncbi:MAG TPA: hydroxymethylglutaryl-CoA lyase [Fontimonas sp.]
MGEFVAVNEVGPRDGLQNQPRILAPAQRLQLIEALLDAGLRHIEFGSFVSPKAVPAMAGSDELAAQLPMDRGEFSALIPNRKGYELARAAGVRSMMLVVAASDTMNQKNIRMSTADALAACADVLAQARTDGADVQACVATAWECPFEGATPPDRVSELTARLLADGASRIVVADTIGAAHPGQVRAFMQRLVGEVGSAKLSCHFHDTRAMGVANAYAALEAGIRRFDASIGGLGGCPFAPGATGNVATEDLVMMLKLMGFATGIDIDNLLVASKLAGELTGAATGGRSLPWLSRNTARLSTH